MSADSQFKDFVERQQQPTVAEDDIDWEKQRDEWLSYLQRLYDQITGYLGEYTAAGTIKLRESFDELDEAHIGPYSAKRLEIGIGVQEIVLKPVGTVLIGAKGRVDVEGSAGYAYLLLIEVDRPPAPPRPKQSRRHKKLKWTWKIVSRPPEMRFIDLNKDTFFQMLMEVSNG